VATWGHTADEAGFGANLDQSVLLNNCWFTHFAITSGA
jgi:hypothetical protein